MVHEIGEHLIADQHHFVVLRPPPQGHAFGPAHHPARGIVWRDDHHGAGPGAAHRVHSRHIQAPVSLQSEGVRHRMYPFQGGQMGKQRIARRRHQHLFAGRAKQFEKPRVGLAGGRGEEEVPGRGPAAPRAPPRQVPRQGLPGRQVALRIRCVVPGRRLQQRLQCGPGRCQAHPGRIALGQVPQRPAGPAVAIQGPGQPVGGECRRQAAGKPPGWGRTGHGPSLTCPAGLQSG